MRSDTTSQDPRDKSLGELLGELSQETATLVRQEVDLAKAELSQKAKAGGQAAGMFGGAAFAGLLAAATFTAFLILVLAEIMPAWVAALVITLVYAGVAAFLALRGKEKAKALAPPVPEQTVETVKEDVEWAKTRMTSGGR
ncbi:MAG TPA: phage holin family protein [Actinomycetota bacterium]|nr:phage holin family protein [Actinomycetota bacterium]